MLFNRQYTVLMMRKVVSKKKKKIQYQPNQALKYSKLHYGYIFV